MERIRPSVRSSNKSSIRISFWRQHPYWGQGFIWGKIISLWGGFSIGCKITNFLGHTLTFGGVIVNNMLMSLSEVINHPKVFCMSCSDQGGVQDGEEQKEDAAQSVCLEKDR